MTFVAIEINVLITNCNTPKLNYKSVSIKDNKEVAINYKSRCNRIHSVKIDVLTTKSEDQVSFLCYIVFSRSFSAARIRVIKYNSRILIW